MRYKRSAPSSGEAVVRSPRVAVHGCLMKNLLVTCLFLASAIPNALDAAPERQSVMTTAQGKDVLSLEDAARSYFLQIALIVQQHPGPNMKQSAKEVLRDRDGLTEAEAEEVISIARRLSGPEAEESRRAESRLSRQKLCTDLQLAASPGEALLLLEGAQAQSLARNRLAGANLLSELRPSTRTRVTKAIMEHRDATIVRRVDTKKLKAEEIEAYKTQQCSQAAKAVGGTTRIIASGFASQFSPSWKTYRAFATYRFL